MGNQGNAILSPKGILRHLLNQVKQLDYRKLAGLTKDGTVTNKQYHILSIENIQNLAINNNWGLCRSHEQIYLYNGAYWCPIEAKDFQSFLGVAAERMGVNKFEARHYSFRDQLYKQFLASGHLVLPDHKKDTVLINLINGTFEIGLDKRKLREPDRNDFLTYQLPFKYDMYARAPKFQNFLNQVLPDIERQMVLAEYLGYVFIRNGKLKLEKLLLLYGTGANGKSVFFEIVRALLGKDNVSSFSLQQLTDVERGGPHRAKIGDKLLNYSSELSGKLETSLFKAMVSGEPIEARPLYSQPYELDQYAKLIFNCNELPKDVEQSTAFFRRFMIVPFDVTIKDCDQDPELSKKIIEKELSGVFNWMLEGLNRILTQKRFTECQAAKIQLEQYKKLSDSVKLFIEDGNYQSSVEDTILQKDLFLEYKAFCVDNHYKICSMKTFGERVRSCGFEIEKKAVGRVVFMKR